MMNLRKVGISLCPSANLPKGSMTDDLTYCLRLLCILCNIGQKARRKKSSAIRAHGEVLAMHTDAHGQKIINGSISSRLRFATRSELFQKATSGKREAANCPSVGAFGLELTRSGWRGYRRSSQVEIVGYQNLCQPLGRFFDIFRGENSSVRSIGSASISGKASGGAFGLVSCSNPAQGGGT
jgi:hypothetical protein